MNYILVFFVLGNLGFMASNLADRPGLALFNGLCGLVCWQGIRVKPSPTKTRQG